MAVFVDVGIFDDERFELERFDHGAVCGDLYVSGWHDGDVIVYDERHVAEQQFPEPFGFLSAGYHDVDGDQPVCVFVVDGERAVYVRRLFVQSFDGAMVFAVWPYGFYVERVMVLEW